MLSCTDAWRMCSADACLMALCGARKQLWGAWGLQVCQGREMRGATLVSRAGPTSRDTTGATLLLQASRLARWLWVRGTRPMGTASASSPPSVRSCSLCL